MLQTRLTPLVLPILAAALAACSALSPTPTPRARSPFADAPTYTPAPTQVWTVSAPSPAAATPTPQISDFPPFRLAAPIPSELVGITNQLVWGPNQTLWLLTDSSAAFFKDGVWTPFITELSDPLLGLDSSGRLWTSAPDGATIQYYDGAQWTVYGEADGWSMIDMYAILPVLPGLTEDAQGGLWVRTAQDLRRFDGARWTVFSREEIGFAPANSEDSYPIYQLAAAPDGEMWAGVCDYSGPGPIGGSGLRRFNGKTWSPPDGMTVPEQCVSLLKADPQGGIWAGVGKDLYQRSADGSWMHISAPEISNQPEETHIGYVNDIAFDPQGTPYVLYALCGGASCDTAEVWLRLDARAESSNPYQQLGDPREPTYQSLVFDARGTPWLVGSMGQLGVLTGDPAEELIGFNTLAGLSDSSGQLWIAAVVKDQAGLWTITK